MMLSRSKLARSDEVPEDFPGTSVQSPPGQIRCEMNARFPKLHVFLFVTTPNRFDHTIMSTAAKLTFASTTVGAIGIVLFVHYQQKADQAVSINRVQ